MHLKDVAERVIQLEIQALSGLLDILDDEWEKAVQLIRNVPGRVILLGVGKSGHVGRKIAATLASTGTPAFFVHAAEASHGDLGMITAADVVIAISNSGNTAEIISIVPAILDLGAKLVAITGNPTSRLADSADVTLDIGVRQEADPLGLVPTSSTTATLALGDAIAITVAVSRNFSREDFSRCHPGGSLGQLLASDKICVPAGLSDLQPIPDLQPISTPQPIAS
ncbi:MAG: SIS domain-containing protein [Phormidesmis sp.]